MQFLDLPFFERALRGLMAAICQLIYPLIAWLYNLFINISKVNILSEDSVAPIYQRVTILLTVIMVFYVTFQFVKYIVQPDEITDKEKGVGNIVYKMIAVVVLIAFVPSIFKGAFWIQSKIINNDLIGKVILGTANNDVKDFGQEFSANIFGMFYKFEADEERGIEEDEECDGAECRMIVNMNLQFLREQGSLKYLSVGLNESKDVSTNVKGKDEEMALITFDYFMAVLIGAVVAWMLLMYCIEAGTRWAQLVFLQIIAPIPIIGYLSPKKDGIFQKWCKQCLTTYLDLFIRMAILSFILLVCQILTNSLSSGELFSGLTGISEWMKTLIYIALILGLMLFGQKAPKMLQELFPSSNAASGNFGLKPGERFAPIKNAWGNVKKAGSAVGKTLNTGKRVVGGAAGALAGAAMGARTGRFFSGMIKGGKAGASKQGGLIGNVKKGINDVRRDVEKDKDIKAAGGSYYGARFFGGHYDSVAKKQDRKIEELKAAKSGKDTVLAKADEFKQVKTIKKDWEAAKASGDAELARNLEAKYKAANQAVRKAIVANGGKLPTSPVSFTYSEVDEFGRKKPGTSKTENYIFDAGDSTFAEALNHAAEEERRKTKGTALDDVEIEIGGVMRKVGDLSAEEYAANIHTIADNAATAETKEQNAKYSKAHANAKGASDN